MKEIFPEEEYKLRPLSEDHPVWRAKHLLSPEIHPLWGIEHGCRTVVIYSPHGPLLLLEPVRAQSRPTPAVIKAIKVGQNVIDYATGREMPADKLTIREVHNFKADAPKRGALRIAKLKHAGDWNVAPQAIPNLMDALRKPPYQLRRRDHSEGSVSARSQPDLLPAHLHPRPGGLVVSARKTSTPCASTSSPAAGRSSPTPPAAARPSTPPFAGSSPSCSPTTRWSRSPATTSFSPTKVGVDLSDVQYTKGAGGGRDFPQLEGVKINDHWVDHLLEVRHRLRPGAAHRHRVQGLHLRKRAQDRRQHRDLLHAAVTGRVRSGA